MNGPFKLADLEIVGYATALTESMLPSTVPPVFHLRGENGKYVLPPYHLADVHLYHGVEVDDEKLKQLEADGQITLFGTTMPAKRDHALWLARDFEPTYEPLADAEAKLHAIAEQEVAEAEESLKKGDHAQAVKHANIAIATGVGMLDPLAIKAAVYNLARDAAGVRLMTRMAATLTTANSFKAVIENYTSLMRKPEPAKNGNQIDTAPRGGFMTNMASTRA